MTPHLFEFQWLHIPTHKMPDRPLVWMEKKQNTSLRYEVTTSNKPDRHWKEGTRTCLPERDTNLEPIASKVLTHRCSPAHGSGRVTLCQGTLEIRFSPSRFLNSPSKQEEQHPPLGHELWNTGASFPSPQGRPARTAFPGPWPAQFWFCQQRLHQLFHSVNTLTLKNSCLLSPGNSICFLFFPSTLSLSCVHC